MRYLRLPHSRPADIRTPVIPSADLGSVLEIACGVSDMTGKAIVPPVFLALAMLGPLLSSPSSPVRGVTITINMATLPVAAGLGSSAALSVAVSAALLDVYFACAGLPAVYDSVRGVVDVGAAAFDGGYHPLEAQRALINDWAFAGETLFHGSPSGLDNTVATCVHPRTPRLLISSSHLLCVTWAGTAVRCCT